MGVKGRRYKFVGLEMVTAQEVWEFGVRRLCRCEGRVTE